MRGYLGHASYRKGDLFIKETDGYAERLLHQAKKQMKYRSRLMQSPLSKKFDIPKVISCWDSGFSMEYVNGMNLIEVMQHSPQLLPGIMESITELLQWEFQKSHKRPFKVKPFINKLSSSCPGYISRYIINEAKKLRFSFVSTGQNMGDLTCANMIFTYDKIYLIDLLGTFYRSPYQDVAKLLQEVNLQWSWLMHENKEGCFVQKEYAVFKSYIDNNIPKNQHTHLFYLMCLARLFPYSLHNEEMFKLINTECWRVISNGLYRTG